MVEPVSVILPGAVWITVVGVTRPVPRQAATKRLHRRAGLEGVGQGAIARCAPVRFFRSDGE
jgi:hypothetical protein